MGDATRDETIQRLRVLGHWRAFGRHVPSNELIQAGLDALLAGVDSPSLLLLAGLGRREEHEAQDLFDRALEELDFTFEVPADPTAAKLAMAYWLAEQIASGTMDPAKGADLIWREVAWDLGYPDELQPIVQCAILIDDWDEHWGVPLEELRSKALNAARQLATRNGRAT
ncbi:hypothetical protein K7472_08195 [Streptomyces sp. PTM05]|uniref:Uncharacterized protein n=1 Tax=Streptantibioticus parmotrematis TaxID=2873249 RepID=A0ABS7QNS0_9ACTN|nr:hypothetical protein [Streptantibioticus parmotrematis]MBY8884826.1 hypothetical protein [Streptantibioticus parmotrematis]